MRIQMMTTLVILLMTPLQVFQLQIMMLQKQPEISYLMVSYLNQMITMGNHTTLQMPKCFKPTKAMALPLYLCIRMTTQMIYS